MKKLFTLFIALSFVTIGFAQIWTEDFESNTVGDGLYYYSVEVPPGTGNFITGIASNVTSPPWDVEYGFVVVKPAFTFSVQDVSSNNVFQIDNVERNAPEGNAKWVSELIDVTGKKFNASVDVTWDNAATYDVSDYIKMEFYVDGSVAQTINMTGTYLTANPSPETFTSNNFLTGSQLRVVISSVNNTSDSITFDNVIVNEYVTSNTSIYDIQYTTTPGPNGTYPSPMVDQIVSIKGAVTAIKSGFGYYLQEADGSDAMAGLADWSGIYVNDQALAATVEVGDIVQLTGTVKENAGITIINLVTSSTITEDAPIGYNPDLIYTELEERNESVLNSVRYFRVIDANNSGDVVIFTAGIGLDPTPGVYAYLVPIDNNISDDWPLYNNPGRLYEQITGITNYNSGSFNLSPRDVSDFNWSFVPVESETVNIDANRISAISNSIVLESENATDVSIYNLAGQVVKQLNVQAGRTEIEMNAGVYVVKMNTGNDIITEKVLVK